MLALLEDFAGVARVGVERMEMIFRLIVRCPRER